jgi:hypothetical protein
MKSNSVNNGINKKIKVLSSLVLLLGALAFFGKNCGPIERGEEEKFSGGDSSQQTQPSQPTQCPPVSYSNDIYPMLEKMCSGCHTSGPGPSFLSGNKDADYPKISKLAKEDIEGKGSKLLLKASGKVNHGGGAQIPEGSQEYTKLKCWIDAGAPNN